jgi:hypothetical protein
VRDRRAGRRRSSVPLRRTPALANLIAESNPCDPHGERRPTIPASLQQISRFFHLDGLIENFCNGACDAGEQLAIPLGGPCDPTAGSP